MYVLVRYCCQPLVIDSSRCDLLEEVYDYGSGCLCCTPGGELNQRLNSMIMWGISTTSIIASSSCVHVCTLELCGSTCSAQTKVSSTITC